MKRRSGRVRRTVVPSVLRRRFLRVSAIVVVVIDAMEFEPGAGDPQGRRHEHVEASGQKSREQIYDRITMMSVFGMKSRKDVLQSDVSVEIDEIAEKETPQDARVPSVET